MAFGTSSRSRVLAGGEVPTAPGWFPSKGPSSLESSPSWAARGEGQHQKPGAEAVSGSLFFRGSNRFKRRGGVSKGREEALCSAGRGAADALQQSSQKRHRLREGLRGGHAVSAQASVQFSRCRFFCGYSPSQLSGCRGLLERRSRTVGSEKSRPLQRAALTGASSLCVSGDEQGIIHRSGHASHSPAVMSKLKSSESVRVVVRCRPMNSKEKTASYEKVVNVDVKLGQVSVKNPRGTAHELPKTFTFDAVYDWNSKQVELYDETFRPLVDSVLQGFNGTIFAYGQTGTGKTYTMEGVRGDPEKRGVIPNSFDHIFTHISRSQNQQYLVRASYLEIYQEEIRDLLSKDQSKRLELKERPDTGVYVKDLSSFVTKSVKEIEHVMNVGNQNRSVGATNMNEHSSRSHAIFVITIECSELGLDGENHIRVGKLNLVDLAGSERQTKTGAQGERLKEATKINLSLSALGNVISALVDGKSTHIPYRDSKLTRLLQDSLGGNAKTVMVANIGPASYNVEETLTTLRYANRAKNIKNKPRVNEDPKDALLREFQEEIARLKAQLEKRSIGKRKRRERRREGGEEEEDAEEGEDEGDDKDDYWREQQEKLEIEKKAIVEDHSLVAEEKMRLLKEKEKKMEDLRREKEATEMLSAKIKVRSLTCSFGKQLFPGGAEGCPGWQVVPEKSPAQ